MSTPRPHAQLTFAIDKTDVLSRDTEGDPICTLLVEVSFDDGRRLSAKIPDNPIKPMFRAIRELGERKVVLMGLGLDTPAVDLHLEMDGEGRVLATLHPFPAPLGTINLPTGPHSDQSHAVVERISSFVAELGRAGDDMRRLTQVELRKFIDGITFSKSEGFQLQADVTLALRDMHFWTRPRELLNAMLALLGEVATDRLTPRADIPALVRDQETYLGPLRRIADQRG